jgi:CheY-like chemotaxis protein
MQKSKTSLLFDTPVMAENISFREKEHLNLSAGDYVKISVRDFGTGIPQEVLPSIFDPFFTTKPAGHGLGLSTCYSIVKRHNGDIDVESEPGKGSTFHVYLPALREPVPLSMAKEAVLHRGSGTILVMDDEKILQEVFSKSLGFFGYTVIAKGNGRDAVDFFSSETRAGNNFVCVFLDLTVPGGMGGKEAVEEIRKLDKTIPVFVASGYTEHPVMASPKGYGFTASISKPFTMADLAVLLNRFLMPRK